MRRLEKQTSQGWGVVANVDAKVAHSEHALVGVTNTVDVLGNVKVNEFIQISDAVKQIRHGCVGVGDGCLQISPRFSGSLGSLGPDVTKDLDLVIIINYKNSTISLDCCGVSSILNVLSHEGRGLKKRPDPLQNCEGRLDLTNLIGVIQQRLEGFLRLVGGGFGQSFELIEPLFDPGSVIFALGLTSRRRFGSAFQIEQLDTIGTTDEQLKVVSNQVLQTLHLIVGLVVQLGNRLLQLLKASVPMNERQKEERIEVIIRREEG
mmetsp:Transcript_21142/g.60629  ORF Transcript_21142/g.60629 Transcript_21142/m.60629 type:complete len:263 (-) Transcript_21142:1484-2272(-)